MTKKTPTEEDVDAGTQLDLIDVAPENLAEIKPIAKKYRAAVKKRMAAGEVEQELKQQVLALVLDGIEKKRITRLPDGSVRFKCDGMTISVTPRDELLKVKEDGDDEKDATNDDEKDATNDEKDTTTDERLYQT